MRHKHRHPLAGGLLMALAMPLVSGCVSSSDPESPVNAADFLLVTFTCAASYPQVVCDGYVDCLAIGDGAPCDNILEYWNRHRQVARFDQFTNQLIPLSGREPLVDLETGETQANMTYRRCVEDGYDAASCEDYATCIADGGDTGACGSLRVVCEERL